VVHEGDKPRGSQSGEFKHTRCENNSLPHPNEYVTHINIYKE